MLCKRDLRAEDPAPASATGVTEALVRVDSGGGEQSARYAELLAKWPGRVDVQHVAIEGHKSTGYARGVHRRIERDEAEQDAAVAVRDEHPDVAIG